MNTRKWLARLGPKTPQLTRIMHGSGGYSDSDSLTPQDIAAALGFIKTQPGRDLYEFLWVPNASKNAMKRNALTVAFASALREEQNRRIRKGERKFPDPPAKLCLSPDGKNTIFRFALKLAACCLNELTNRNDCPACKGFGQVVLKDGVGINFADCLDCYGHGTVAFSQSHRAKLLNIRKETYASNVEEAYRWLLGYMRHQEMDAANEHWRAMQ